MAHSRVYDVAIIGGGIAGLSVALRLPEAMHVALFTKGQLGESNTRYAQGGLAVAMGADDSPELHFKDTMAAGAGLCDEAAVRILVEQAPTAVSWLMQMGVQFDRAQAGSDRVFFDQPAAVPKAIPYATAVGLSPIGSLRYAEDVLRIGRSMRVGEGLTPRGPLPPGAAAGADWLL